MAPLLMLSLAALAGTDAGFVALAPGGEPSAGAVVQLTAGELLVTTATTAEPRRWSAWQVASADGGLSAVRLAELDGRPTRVEARAALGALMVTAHGGDRPFSLWRLGAGRAVRLGEFERAITLGDGSKASDALVVVEPPARRGEAYRYWAIDVTGVAPPRLAAEASLGDKVICAPSRAAVCVVQERDAVVRWVEGRREGALFETSKQLDNLELSPDGRFLAMNGMFVSLLVFDADRRDFIVVDGTRLRRTRSLDVLEPEGTQRDPKACGVWRPVRWAGTGAKTSLQAEEVEGDEGGPYCAERRARFDLAALTVTWLPATAEQSEGDFAQERWGMHQICAPGGANPWLCKQVDVYGSSERLTAHWLDANRAVVAITELDSGVRLPAKLLIVSPRSRAESSVELGGPLALVDVKALTAATLPSPPGFRLLAVLGQHLVFVDARSENPVVGTLPAGERVLVTPSGAARAPGAPPAAVSPDSHAGRTSSSADQSR